MGKRKFFAKTRTFKGKTFTLHKSFKSIVDASSEAERVKKKGNRIRVVPRTRPSRHAVYKRRK